MKNKIATHFYVKEARKDSKGESPIYLRITINGERAEISSNRKIDPDLWDKKSERVSGRTESARAINAHLNGIIGKVEKYFSNHDMQDEQIKVLQIINELKGKGQNSFTLVESYEKHIAMMERLEGVDYASNTIKRYKSSLNGLKEFLEKNLKKSNIKLTDLDKLFIESYEVYLKSNKSLKQNSAAKDIKNLRRVINRALSYNWITKDPFKDYSCPYVNPGRSFLTAAKNGQIDHLTPD